MDVSSAKILAEVYKNNHEIIHKQLAGKNDKVI